MRPNNQHHITSTSTFQGRKQAMTLDENSLAHLMTVLTNLYSDEALATIREYASNAWDSHVAAGNPQPIIVSLPSDLNPTYEVTDHGVGLSVDELYDVYSKYGMSTKRETDEQTGMLGLGCKAALAYTDQFTVTAVKDGVRALAILSRGSDGTGSIEVVDTSTTVERNGVTVSVPVSDVRSFNEKANNFFAFWTPGTVLVNGKEPALPEGMWVDDNTYVTSKVSSDYAVMGNVAYPIDTYSMGYSWRTGLPYGYKVVLYVPMGTVNFTPSRDALNYTALTKGTLSEAIRGLGDKVKAKAQEDIDNATDATEAFDRVLQWAGLYGANTYKWKGSDVPLSFAPDSGIINYSTKRYKHKAQRQGRIDARSLNGFILIYGFTPNTLSANHRKKLDKYREDNDLMDKTDFIITEHRIGAPWTDNLTHIDWEDIRSIKLPRKSGSKSGGGEPIRAWNGTGWEVVEDDDDGDGIVYYSPATEDVDTNYLTSVLPGKRIVCIGRNRWDKFQREHPEAVTAQEAIKVRVKEFVDGLTASQRVAIVDGYSHEEPFKGINPSKFDDPDLADAVRTLQAAHKDRDSSSNYNRLTQAYRRLTGSWDVPAVTSDTLNECNATIDKYPFLRYTKHVSAEHTIKYANMMFADKDEA